MSVYIWIIIGFLIIIFLGLSKSKYKLRSVVEDFEAKLESTGANEFSQFGRGEVERELYGDGSAELKIQFSSSNLPDGSIVSLMIDGVHAGDFEVSNGRDYQRIDSQSGRTVPSVKTGDTADVIYDDITILSGIFYPD